MTKKKPEPNPIEEAIGERAKTVLKPDSIQESNFPQNPGDVPEEPTPSEMLSLEELNLRTVERLEEKWPEEPSPPVSKPDLQPVTENSSQESPPQKIEIFVDGAVRDNYNRAAIGCVIKVDGVTKEEISKEIGPATNNEAEYHAVIAGLVIASQMNAEAITLYSDSELVVNQLCGKYKVKSSALAKFYFEARDLLQKANCQLIHIPREQNREADVLANNAFAKNIDREVAEIEVIEKEIHPVAKPIPDTKKLPSDFKVEHTYETGIAGAKQKDLEKKFEKEIVTDGETPQTLWTCLECSEVITSPECPESHKCNEVSTIEKEIAEYLGLTKVNSAEDIELTALRKHIQSDGFVLSTVAYHIVSLCAQPMTTPSTTTWDFGERAEIPAMVLALLNQPGYLEGIWPSLKIVMGTNKGNVAWCAGIATTIAFFDTIRVLPALKELKNGD